MDEICVKLTDDEARKLNSFLAGGYENGSESCARWFCMTEKELLRFMVGIARKIGKALEK